MRVPLAARELLRPGEADVGEADVERESLAPGDRAAAGSVERVPHRREARLRRAVRVVDPGLPAEERRLVLRVEEQYAGHGRLAEGEAQDWVRRGRLLVLGDGLRGGRLGARVEARLLCRDRRLDAELVVEDPQRRAPLRGGGESGAGQGHAL